MNNRSEPLAARLYAGAEVLGAFMATVTAAQLPPSRSDPSGA
ncbi:MAG: hypothetical protein ACJ746_06865 [Bryobacteraceae bacterium]